MGDSMSDDQIELEIQQKGLNAPRVTPKAIEDRIVGEFYFTLGAALDNSSIMNEAINLPLDTALYDALRQKLDVFTVCVLQCDNGFAVFGESAPVSPENFDVALGKKIAKQKAVDKLWPALGFMMLEDKFRAPAELPV